MTHYGSDTTNSFKTSFTFLLIHQYFKFYLGHGSRCVRTQQNPNISPLLLKLILVLTEMHSSEKKAQGLDQVRQTSLLTASSDHPARLPRTNATANGAIAPGRQEKEPV